MNSPLIANLSRHTGQHSAAVPICHASMVLPTDSFKQMQHVDQSKSNPLGFVGHLDLF